MQLNHEATVKPAAFSQVAQIHRSALRAMALRLCRNSADADDLVQDALERGLKGFGRLGPESNPRSWLLTVLHNRFIDLCRRRSRRPRETPIDGVSLAAPVPDSPPSWADVTNDEVLAALAQIGDDFRRVHDLHVLEKRSYEDIAGILGIPRATVGTRLLRARRRLRELLRREVACH